MKGPRGLGALWTLSHLVSLYEKMLRNMSSENFRSQINLNTPQKYSASPIHVLFCLSELDYLFLISSLVLSITKEHYDFSSLSFQM